MFLLIQVENIQISLKCRCFHEHALNAKLPYLLLIVSFVKSILILSNINSFTDHWSYFSGNISESYIFRFSFSICLFRGTKLSSPSSYEGMFFDDLLSVYDINEILPIPQSVVFGVGYCYLWWIVCINLKREIFSYDQNFYQMCSEVVYLYYVIHIFAYYTVWCNRQIQRKGMYLST